MPVHHFISIAIDGFERHGPMRAIFAFRHRTPPSGEGDLEFGQRSPKFPLVQGFLNIALLEPCHARFAVAALDANQSHTGPAYVELFHHSLERREFHDILAMRASFGVLFRDDAIAIAMKIHTTWLKTNTHSALHGRKRSLT
jgi:hypothetical protein